MLVFGVAPFANKSCTTPLNSWAHRWIHGPTFGQWHCFPRKTKGGRMMITWGLNQAHLTWTTTTLCREVDSSLNGKSSVSQSQVVGNQPKPTAFFHLSFGAKGTWNRLKSDMPGGPPMPPGRHVFDIQQFSIGTSHSWSKLVKSPRPNSTMLGNQSPNMHCKQTTHWQKKWDCPSPIESLVLTCSRISWISPIFDFRHIFSVTLFMIFDETSCSTLT